MSSHLSLLPAGLSTLVSTLLLVLAGLAPPVWAAGASGKGGKASNDIVIEGRVTSVVDGDSLWVTPADNSAAIEVRLLDIDAPEICQEWGDEARRYLADQVLRQPVRLVVPRRGTAHDSYGRALGFVYLGEVNINVRLVEEGHAWSARTRGGRGPYLKQETMARALRRGLHQVGSAAVMPVDFRHSHGPCLAKPPAASAPAKKK